MSACGSDALHQEVHAYGSEVAADFAPATGNTSLIRARVGRLRSALAERRRSAGHFLGVWVALLETREWPGPRYLAQTKAELVSCTCMCIRNRAARQ
jgi:hypothetical protein